MTSFLRFYFPVIKRNKIIHYHLLYVVSWHCFDDYLRLSDRTSELLHRFDSLLGGLSFCLLPRAIIRAMQNWKKRIKKTEHTLGIKSLLTTWIIIIIISDIYQGSSTHSNCVCTIALMKAWCIYFAAPSRKATFLSNRRREKNSCSRRFTCTKQSSFNKGAS